MPRPVPVWTLNDEDRAQLDKLGTFNGFGVQLLGGSRTDDTGRRFMTAWFMLSLPLIPLGRYYVRKGATTFDGNMAYSVERTDYTFSGVARLRLLDVVRTYLVFWLIGPATVLLPWIWIIGKFSEIPSDTSAWLFFLALAGVALAPVALVIGLVWCITLYQKHWAPLYEVRFVG